jgi:hypothetical protein
MKSTENIRLERFAVSSRCNEIIEAARAKSKALPLKKGTEAYLVSSRYGSPVVVAEAVRIESFGKRQGTATRTSGDFLKLQLWVGHSLLFIDRADVEAFAAESGPITYREALLGSAHCSAANIPNLRSDLVAKVEAEVEDLLTRAEVPVTGTVEWR